MRALARPTWVPGLLTEPESLLEKAWESPDLTPGGSLELLQAGGHQEGNTFKGEKERGPAGSRPRKVAPWFTEEIALNTVFPNWCPRSGSFGSESPLEASAVPDALTRSIRTTWKT